MKGGVNMFNVRANVYHNHLLTEHIVRSYKDFANAIRYMKALIYILDGMQKDGSVTTYDVQLFSICEEADKC